jgi:hypothetical protein
MHHAVGEQRRVLCAEGHVLCASSTSVCRLDPGKGLLVWSVPSELVVGPTIPFRSFGVALPELMMRERFLRPGARLPFVWETLVAQLRRTNALACEGVFCMSGSSDAIDDLIRELEARRDSHLSRDPHVVACTLKRWLGQLLHPIVPQSICLPAFEAVRAHPDGGELERLLLRQLAELPADNCSILLELLQLLRGTLGLTAQNKLTAGPLVSLFAPLVTHSQDDMVTYVANRAVEAHWLEVLLLIPHDACATIRGMSPVPTLWKGPATHHQLTLAVSGSFLLVAGHCALLGLNQSDGSLGFRVPLPALGKGRSFLIEPSKSEPLVFVAGSKSVHCVDVMRGEVRWSTSLRAGEVSTYCALYPIVCRA